MYHHKMFLVLLMCILSVYNLPYIVDNDRINPQVRKIYEGMDAHFKCTSAGVISWQFPKQKVPVNNIYTYNNTLYITNATKLNAGIYICRGNTYQNEVFFAKGQLIVVGMYTMTSSSTIVLPYYYKSKHYY